jgi:hypothetical protein
VSGRLNHHVAEKYGVDPEKPIATYLAQIEVHNPEKTPIERKGEVEYHLTATVDGEPVYSRTHWSPAGIRECIGDARGAVEKALEGGE